MRQSGEAMSLETCVKKNLEKMFYKIPRFSVCECEDKYVITIKPNDADLECIGSVRTIKRWVKEWGRVPYSKMTGHKFKHSMLGNEIRLNVYK